MCSTNFLPLVSALLLLASAPSVVRTECKVESQSYSSNDGLVVARVAHIVTFTAQCSDKTTGLTSLYADLNGQTLPVIRSADNLQNIYQISWVVDLNKASSGRLSIPIYDEEGYAVLKKAQRAGQSPPAPLFSLDVSHSSPYKGPIIQSELVATLAALGLWWLAYNAKAKLTN